MNKHAAFERIVGQEWACAYLSGALQNNRLPQTMIFHGPPYVGKESTALALASILLCETKSGCGSCTSCLQVLSYQHPDLHYIFPCPASWYNSKDEYGAVLASRTRDENRFGEPIEDPNHIISIEAIRWMTKAANRSSFGGRAKVFIVRNADRMRDEGQNALLKLLEEAPDDTYIVLCTTQPRRLLATVRSRSHSVRFSLLSEADWIDIFKTICSVDEKTGSLLHRLSGGSFSRAMEMQNEESQEARTEAFNALIAASTGKPGVWSLFMARKFRDTRNRGSFDRFLDNLILWLRDALIPVEGRRRSGGVFNCDRLIDIERISSVMRREDLVTVIAEVEKLRQATRLNLDVRLCCYRLERVLRSHMENPQE